MTRIICFCAMYWKLGPCVVAAARLHKRQYIPTYSTYTHTYMHKGKGKVNFNLEQNMKAQRGSRSIALLFL